METTQTFEKFSKSLSEIFSQLWIPKPQFWYPPLRFGPQSQVPKPLIFLVFWVYTVAFGLSAREQIFPKVPVIKIRVSAPALYKNPTVRHGSEDLVPSVSMYFALACSLGLAISIVVDERC